MKSIASVPLFAGVGGTGLGRRGRPLGRLLWLRRAFASGANTPVRSGSGRMALGSGLPGSGGGGRRRPWTSRLDKLGPGRLAGPVGGGAGSIGGRSCLLGLRTRHQVPEGRHGRPGDRGRRDEIRRDWSEGAAGPGLLDIVACRDLPRQVVCSRHQPAWTGRAMRLGEFRGQLEAVEAAARQSRVPIERAFRAPASRVRALLRRSPELDAGGAAGVDGDQSRPGAAVPWGRAERGNGRRAQRSWAPTARVRGGRWPHRRTGRLVTRSQGRAHRASAASAGALVGAGREGWRHFYAWLGWRRHVGARLGSRRRCGAVSDRCRLRSGRFGPELRLTQHGPGCPAQDLRFDQQVVGSAEQHQVLDIVPPYDHQLSLAVQAEGVDNAKPGLAPAGGAALQLSRAPASLRSTSAKIASSAKMMAKATAQTTGVGSEYPSRDCKGHDSQRCRQRSCHGQDSNPTQVYRVKQIVAKRHSPSVVYPKLTMHAAFFAQ